MSDQSPKLREPGQRVFNKPKPELRLVTPAAQSKAVGPVSEMPPEVKEMLREMNQRKRQRDHDDPETPAAA